MKMWTLGAGSALWLLITGPVTGQTAAARSAESKHLITSPKVTFITEHDLDLIQIIDFNEQYTKEVGGRPVAYAKATGRPLDGRYSICMSTSSIVRDLVYPATLLCTSGRYRRGWREGHWTFVDYEADGAKEVMYYRRGMLHGPYVVVDSVGRALYRTCFSDGTGYSKSFYRNGRLREEGYLRRGQMHGRWVSYDRAGRVTKAAVYQDGALCYTEPVLP